MKTRFTTYSFGYMPLMGSKKGIVESSLLEVVIRLTARFAHHNVGKEGYQAKKGIFEPLLILF